MISFLQAAVPLLLLANASTMHLGHSLTLDQLDVSLVMALINISVPRGHIVICFQGHRQSKDDHFPAEISHGSVRPRSLEPFDHLLREVHTTGVLSTTLLVGSTGSISHIDREVSIYVIYISFGLNDTKTLRKQVGVFSRDSLWNPRAIFILVSTKEICGQSQRKMLSKLVMEVLWEKDVANVVVVIPSDRCNGDKRGIFFDLFTWNPYHSPRSTCEVAKPKVKFLSSWSNVGFSRNFTLFPRRVLKNMHGCPVTFSTFPYSPYVGVRVEDFGAKSIKVRTSPDYKNGIEILLVRLLSETTNFQIVYLPVPINNWTGIIDELMKGKSDVAFCSMSSSVERYRALEATVSYLDEAIVWFVPQKRPIPRWMSLLKVFSPSFWYLVVVIYFLASLTFWKVNRGNKTFVRSLMSTWSSMLGMQIVIPSGIVSRAFYIMWAIYCLQIITAHNSSLISVLAQPGFLPRITSFDELIAADIRFGFIDYITHFFEDHDDWRYIKVVREHQSCNKINLCLDRMAYYGDFAVAAPKIFMLNRVSKYISQDGRPMFVPLDNYVVRGGIVMYLTKGSFLLNRFNEIINGVVEFGFMNKWMKDLKKADVELKDINKVYEQKPYVLTLSHLQGPFVWLGTGLSFALMAFMGEMRCKRFRKCYQFEKR